MKTSAASSCVVTRPSRRSTKSAFTLVEVMIALVLVAMMGASTFAGMQQVSRMALNSAIRNEAHRLLQAEAERLMSVAFGSCTASGNQTITSSIKTTFSPGAQPQMAYPASGNTGRVSFTRRVVDVGSTPTSVTLRVEVQWTWQGKTTVISAPVHRVLM